MAPNQQIVDCSTGSLLFTANSYTSDKCGEVFSTMTQISITDLITIRLLVHASDAVSLNGFQLKFIELTAPGMCSVT